MKGTKFGQRYGTQVEEWKQSFITRWFEYRCWVAVPDSTFATHGRRADPDVDQG